MILDKDNNVWSETDDGIEIVGKIKFDNDRGEYYFKPNKRWRFYHDAFIAMQRIMEDLC